MNECNVKSIHLWTGNRFVWKVAFGVASEIILAQLLVRRRSDVIEQIDKLQNDFFGICVFVFTFNDLLSKVKYALPFLMMFNFFPFSNPSRCDKILKNPASRNVTKSYFPELKPTTGI